MAACPEEKSMSASQEAKPIRGDCLMRPGDVAKKLNVSVKTVYLMAADNELPPHRIRSCLRFDSADVDDYLFFSKYRRDNFRLTPSDKKELFERVNAQIEQAKDFIQKLLDYNPQRKKGGGNEAVNRTLLAKRGLGATQLSPASNSTDQREGVK
jgi:excisionase family DNA binding protein